MSTQRERLMESISTSADGHAVKLSQAEEVTAPKQATGLPLSPVRRLAPAEVKLSPENSAAFAPLSLPDFERLKADIAERGIIVPLILKQDKTLIAGHNRLRAAQDLGLEVVPVQYVETELSPAQEKAFVIKDNLLRRHLTAEQKGAALKAIYGQEILAAKHGGSRKDTESGSRFTVNLAQKIAKETGLPTGTAKRYIADIRRTDSPRKTPPKPTGKAQKGATGQGRGQGKGDGEAALRAFNSALNDALKKVEMEPASVLKVAVRHAKSWLKDVERKHRAAERVK